MPYIPPPRAQTLFADLTHDAQLPIDHNELTRSRRFAAHDHVVLGDTVVRRYKHHGKWKYLEQDIRRAGQALAQFTFDPRDTAPAQLRRGDERPWPERVTDWRARIGSHMDTIASNNLNSAQTTAPDAATWATLRSSTWSLAGTFPLRLLDHSDGQWLLPHACVELLDRWQEREEDLTARAGNCQDCGTPSPGAYEWRTLEDTGYVTRCPACSRARFPRYADQLAGRTYTWARNSRHRAADYLCRLCQAQRAFAWDHCHQPAHQYVRGPLCGGCNTAESNPLSAFLQRDGAARYLLHCPSCRRDRDLPDRHHAVVAGAHLAQAQPRHCTAPARVAPVPGTTPYGGALRYTLHCSRHPWTGAWAAEVPAAQAQALVRDFVDTVLADDTAH
ncbi:endonuclease domain-containing protein [Streptomyces sp. CAU 1734]|uniref:endonuclease domain-containing protein n=1 Tax=Streptomyces sp. CAU 1734 TaxID=3140360 RepID=UPI0032602A4A